MLYNDYLQVGGERLSVEAEVCGLRNSGHDVLQLVQHNDALASCGRLSNARAIVRPPRDGNIGDRIATALRNFRPDVVHCQNLFPLLGAAAIRALEEAGVPYVRHIRNYRLRCLSADLWRDGRPCQDCRSSAAGISGVLHGCYKSSRIASAGAAAYSRLEQRASQLYPPDAYILVSRSMIAQLSTVLDPRASICVKPNSIAADTCHSGGEQFLFAGRLTDEKGWQLFADVATELPEQRFVNVGDGPGAPRLATPIDSTANLEWVREMENDALLRAVSKSRAVLVPSAWEEPFGRVAAESLGVGTPCLVSAHGGCRTSSAGCLRTSSWRTTVCPPGSPLSSTCPRSRLTTTRRCAADATAWPRASSHRRRRRHSSLRSTIRCWLLRRGVNEGELQTL